MARTGKSFFISTTWPDFSAGNQAMEWLLEQSLATTNTAVIFVDNWNVLKHLSWPIWGPIFGKLSNAPQSFKDILLRASTINSKVSQTDNSPILAFLGSDIVLDCVDSLNCKADVVHLTNTPSEGMEWREAHLAVNLTTGKAVEDKVMPTIPDEVRSVLNLLHEGLNPNSRSKFNNLKNARAQFREIKNKGHILDEARIRQYFRRLKWDPADARKVAEQVRK